MQADARGRNRSVALVLDRLTIDQRKSPQCRDSLVQALIGEHRRQRLIEVLLGFGEQEERDWLRRQQRRVYNQRLGSWMKLSRLIDRKRKCLRDGQTVMVI